MNVVSPVSKDVSDRDIRDFLIGRAITSLRQSAGFIPPIMDDDFFSNLTFTVSIVKVTRVTHTIAYCTILTPEFPICCTCVSKLKRFLRGTSDMKKGHMNLVIRVTSGYGLCECCDGAYSDIPF